MWGICDVYRTRKTESFKPAGVLCDTGATLNNMRTIEKIITKVDARFGAPMGRQNKGSETLAYPKKIYDCRVPLDSGGYDRGGAYWGFPNSLRVSYTKDLNFVKFYRS